MMAMISKILKLYTLNLSSLQLVDYGSVKLYSKNCLHLCLSHTRTGAGNSDPFHRTFKTIQNRRGKSRVTQKWGEIWWQLLPTILFQSCGSGIMQNILWWLQFVRDQLCAGNATWFNSLGDMVFLFLAHRLSSPQHAGDSSPALTYVVPFSGEEKGVHYYNPILTYAHPISQVLATSWIFEGKSLQCVCAQLCAENRGCSWSLNIHPKLQISESIFSNPCQWTSAAWRGDSKWETAWQSLVPGLPQPQQQAPYHLTSLCCALHSPLFCQPRSPKHRWSYWVQVLAYPQSVLLNTLP